MKLIAILLAVLAAPGGHELRYRFSKDMRYRDTQKRDFALETYVEGRTLRWEVSLHITLIRTILEIDKTAHPKMERVKVVQFRRVVHKAVEENAKLGAIPEKCEGQTFIWRRLKRRWGLFDRDSEVTKDHKMLVDQLKNWRDARMPDRALTRGETWEVSPRRFLQTAGFSVPDGAQGVAQFTLEKVESGIATIPFEFSFSYKEMGNQMSVAEKGIWTFDITNGRDVYFEMKGLIEVNGGKSGKGAIKMKREVTYD